MVSPLNFFAPYERMPGHYENQLTRALLVVLRYSPLAHASWLRLAAPNEQLEKLPTPQLRTQTARVLHQEFTNAGLAEIRGLSVLLEPAARTSSDTPRSPVKESERDHILDGVIQYGDQLVMVIENKLFAGTNTEQPCQLNLRGVPIKFDPEVRVISWQRVLEAFSDIAAGHLVHGAERLVIQDFLDYAEHHFPQLGPFSTLRRCAGSTPRILRRLDTIAAVASGQEERNTTGDGWRELPARVQGSQSCVDMMQLKFDEATGEVVLSLYPGDTLTQARILYARPNEVRTLFTLEGWELRSNFHWGYRTTGYAWSAGTLDVRAYAEYWIQRIESLNSVPRAEWPSTWDRLIAHGIVAAPERAEFDRHFTATARHTAAPQPGLVCIYRWNLDTARMFDDEPDRFAEDVRTKVNKVLALLGETQIVATDG